MQAVSPTIFGIYTFFYFIKYGVLQGILLFFAGLLNVSFSIFFINLVYMVLLRFMSVAQFQQLISYVRMIMLGLLLLGYYAWNNIEGENISILFGKWSYAIPPLWFSTINKLYDSPDIQTIIMTLLGILAPLCALVISAKWFAPYFMRKVGNMTAASFYKKNKTGRTDKIAKIPASVVTSKPLSRAGFLLSWKLSSGNKYYFQLTMPSIMYVIVFVGMQMWTIVKQGEATNFYIVTLYMPILVSYSIIDALRYTKSGNLFWFFRVKPMEKPGIFLLGAFKGIYVKYFLPVYILLVLILICFAGVRNIPNLIFPFCATTLFSMILMKSYCPAFPFSLERKKMESIKSLFIFLGLIIGSGIFALFQIMLNKIPYAIPLFLLLLCFVLWFVGKSFQNITWDKIEGQY